MKKKIITAVEPVFLYPLVYQLTIFGQVSALTMLQNLFSRYRTIYEIDLEENSFKIMGPYNPTEPLSRLIQQLKKGREFARSGGQVIAHTMMVPKGITLLAQTEMFNKEIIEWRRQATEQKTW